MLLLDSLQANDQPNNVARYTIRKSLSNTEFLSGSFTTHCFRPHFHQTYTIILINEGIGDYSYGKQQFIVKEGGLIVYNPYDVHAGRAVRNIPWRFKTMYIPVSLMQRAFSQVSGGPGFPHFPPQVLYDQTVFDKGISAFPQDLSPLPANDQEFHLMDFLLPLIDRYALNNIPEITEKADQHFEDLNRIKRYLHDNCNAEITLQHLCDMLGYSESKLIKRFKYCFHLPPKQYLINLKIEKAKALLLNHERSTDIAYQLGFFDQSHFIRHFKKIIGITPKQFVSNIK